MEGTELLAPHEPANSNDVWELSLLNDTEYQAFKRSLNSPFAFEVNPEEIVPHSKRRGQQNSKESTTGSKSNKIDPFLNRYISYVDIYEAKLLEKREGVRNCVEIYVDDEIIAKLKPSTSGSENESSQQILKFEKVQVGSFYEGVKVKHANEFDFLLVPFIEDKTNQQRIEIGPKLTMTRKSLPTIKNIRDRPVQHLSYFSLGTNDQEVENALSSLTGASTGDNGKIPARNVTEKLREMVCEALNRPNSNAVTTNGPAVTLYLSCSERGKKNKYEVKVDLTFALKVDGSISYFDERGTKNTVELNQLTTGPIQHCFFVTAGDFWQCTFSDEQTEIMGKTPKENQSGFRAIKSLRDDLSLSDPLDNTILSTYPLKVAYLNKTFNMDKKRKGEKTKWDADKIDIHVVDMLQSVDEQGAERSMKDIFIKNNAVFHDADKSYLESRRLLHHLKTEQEVYRSHGRVHCCCLSAIIVFLILVVIAMGMGFAEVINKPILPSQPAERCISDPIKYGMLAVGLLCFLIICFALPPCLFVLFNRCFVKRQSKLYQLSYCCLMFLYTCALIFALAVFGVVLSIMIKYYLALINVCNVVLAIKSFLYPTGITAFVLVGIVLIYIPVFYVCLGCCSRRCNNCCEWPRWDLCEIFRRTCVGVCCQKNYHNDFYAWFMCDDIFCRVCCRKEYSTTDKKQPARQLNNRENVV